MGERPRLLLIDGYNNIFRAFYAIRNLSNSKGEPTNAVYGFIQMLRKVLRDEKPDLVGIALDVSDKTVRTEKFADYKANRAPMPEDLRPQIPYIRRAIEAFRIPILELDNYEADDVMGTLAAKGAAAGYDVVLVSADKDLMQLVAPGVSMYHTGRNRLYDAAAVEEDFGVPPARVADVLALMGDAVDNVPGVPGIGEKGARQLIQEYGSVEALLERAAEIPRKAYREGLLAHREDAILSKELATIHTTLPVDLDETALRLEPADTEALRRLYSEMEFRTLLEELGSETATEEGASAATEIREIDDAKGWTSFAERLAAEEWTAFALGDEKPLAIAIGAATRDGSARTAALVDLRRDEPRAALLATLATRAADPTARLVGHDLKELLRLLPDGATATAELVDLMLVSYLLRPSAHGHGFGEIVLERTGRQPMTAKEAGFEKGAVPAPGDPRLTAFARDRLAGAAAVAPGMLAELAAAPALAKLYREIEAPLAPVLVGMEEAGVLLDVEFLAALSKEMGESAAALEAEIYEIAGERFNIQSPQQLGVILFEKLQYPAGRRTRKTKSWSTDADTLGTLAAQGYPLADRLLRFRELTKLKSTYVDALPTMVASDGRVHTRFLQAVAATGRLSSANPNLQNIPVRTEQGQRIRKAFRAPEGALLLVADYSQIELRILAHIAGEPAMIDAFTRGDDIHRSTAAQVLGVAPELVNADQRRAAKTINFGLIYGMSAFGLSQALGITPGEAEQFIAAYFARYGGVQTYMKETLAQAEKEGKVETMYGRIRHLPDIASQNFNLRENARRMAINARIQGTAADFLKKAMIAVDRRLRSEHPGARLLLTVHDELVLEVPEAEIDAVAGVVKSEMEGVERLRVPLVVDTGSGTTWYDAKG